MMFCEALVDLNGTIFEPLWLRMFLTFASGALICLLVGKPYIACMRAWQKSGQPIREDGPKSHLSKSGTPTMGGWMIMFGALASTLLLVRFWQSYVAVSFMVLLAFALIGFLDDYKKVSKNTHVGISARQKLCLQILISSIALVWLRGSELGDVLFTVHVPFIGWSIDLGYLYIPFAITVIIGASNAVNLTDGLDGLASGTMMIALLCMCVIAVISAEVGARVMHLREMALGIAALAGACAGFLYFNKYPARIFMGDTGSLALGSFLGIVSIILKQELLLVLIGGVFVIETLSVIVQVAYFRYSGGKRIFLMAPLHHHFEHKGWSEKKIVSRFYLVAILLAILSMLAFVG